MTRILNYSKIANILLDKLTAAELKVYRVIIDLSETTKEKFVFASIEYVMKKAEYASKSYVSKVIASLVKKGVIYRELVKSSESEFMCYKYHIVDDLEHTRLFMELSDDEKKKYITVIRTDAEQQQPEQTQPEAQPELTPEQQELCNYLKYSCDIKINNKKIIELFDAAKNNKYIADGTELNTIIDIVKHCMQYNAKNKIAYIKTSIMNYEPKINYIAKEDKSEAELSPEAQQLCNECAKMNMCIYPKQAAYIMSVANKLKISVKSVCGIFDSARQSKRKINSMFKYVLGAIYRCAADKKNISNFAGYKLEEFDKFSVTFSANGAKIEAPQPKLTAAPEATATQEQTAEELQPETEQKQTETQPELTAPELQPETEQKQTETQPELTAPELQPEAEQEQTKARQTAAAPTREQIDALLKELQRGV